MPFSQSCRCGNPALCVCFPAHISGHIPQSNPTVSGPQATAPSQVPYGMWASLPHASNSHNGAGMQYNIQYQFSPSPYPAYQPQPPFQYPPPSLSAPLPANTTTNSTLQFQNSFQHSFLTSQGGTGSQRKQTNTSNSSSKRPRTAPASVPRPTVHGVGPPQSIDIDDCDFDCPDTHYGSLITARSAKKTGIVATDVWYCMRGLDSKEKPVTLPEVEEMFHKEQPKTSYVGCRLCKLPYVIQVLCFCPFPKIN